MANLSNTTIHGDILINGDVNCNNRININKDNYTSYITIGSNNLVLNYFNKQNTKGSSIALSESDIFVTGNLFLNKKENIIQTNTNSTITITQDKSIIRLDDTSISLTNKVNIYGDTVISENLIVGTEFNFKKIAGCSEFHMNIADLYIGNADRTDNPTLYFRKKNSYASVFLTDYANGMLNFRTNAIKFIGYSTSYLTSYEIFSNVINFTYNDRLTAIGKESNNISIVHNDNSNITINQPNILASLRQSVKFDWYNTSWEIGNIRGINESTSNGFGFVFNKNKLCFRIDENDAYVGNNKVIHTGSIDVNKNFITLMSSKIHKITYNISGYKITFNDLLIRHGKLKENSFLVLYRKKAKNNRGGKYKRAYQIIGPRNTRYGLSKISSDTFWYTGEVDAFNMGYKIPLNIDNVGYYSIDISKYLHFIEKGTSPQKLYIKGMNSGMSQIGKNYKPNNKIINRVYVNMGCRVFTPNGKTTWEVSPYELYDVSEMIYFKLIIQNTTANEYIINCNM